MSDVVIVLGAGASVEAGAPVMANFIDVAKDLLRSGEVNEFGGDFEHVFNFLQRSQIVHSKAALDLTNLESIFTALEIADLISEKPGSTERDAPAAVLASLKRMIAVTLERKIKFRNEKGHIRPAAGYEQFVMSLKKIRSEGPSGRRSISIITFNYDTALDFSVALSGIPIDYGFEDHVTNALPILKLHGSLNWATESETHEVVPLMPEIYFGNLDRSFLHGDDGPISLGLGTRFGHWFETCLKRKVDPHPVIVPPTWKKGEYHRSLARVWRTAANHLKQAQYIFVSGYSLPETDGFFRLLYALGSASGEPLRYFGVFDPSPNVDARFRAMLGPGAINRYHYEPFPFGNFAAVLPQLLKS
jgi:hypothetical protein